MRLASFTFLIFCTELTLECLGQNVQLKSKLLNADSVFILSHDDTAGIIENPDGSAGPAPPLILDERLNRAVIHESLLLTRKELLNLSIILNAPVVEYQEQVAGCFMPHHSVLMISKGKYWYIEICFHCGRVRASQGIDFSDQDMDQAKWKKLKEFFIGSGFKYELNK
jgi:hypothetical protein